MYRILSGQLTALAFVTALFCSQPVAGQEQNEDVPASPSADKRLDELLKGLKSRDTNAGRGSVRFIRLEYPGGDWDQGIGDDANMLTEYGIRTQQKTAPRTESRSLSALAKFPLGKSPPLVYMTGQKNIEPASADLKILREYLLNKHGMLFGNNGGSKQFHNQFVAMMRRILPDIRPVQIALDDPIHRIPFTIPFMPFVAPYGGKDALGWKVEGRWVCYYHPGNVGAVWADDHAGVKPTVYETGYQLGTNIVFYAHSEYAKWLVRRKKSRDPKDVEDLLDKLLD